MKHYDESFDEQLKKLNNQIHLDEDEKQDLLLSIHGKIEQSKYNPPHFINRSIAWVLTSVAILLFLALTPIIVQENQHVGSPSQDKQVILPENINEIEQPPFEYKLPSYLPFEVLESEAEYEVLENPYGEKRHSMFITYVFKNQNRINISIEDKNYFSLTLNDSDSEVIHSKTSDRKYLYAENSNLQMIVFREYNVQYYIQNILRNNEDYIPKEDFIKIAESLSTFKN